MTSEAPCAACGACGRENCRVVYWTMRLRVASSSSSTNEMPIGEIRRALAAAEVSCVIRAGQRARTLQ